MPVLSQLSYVKVIVAVPIEQPLDYCLPAADSPIPLPGMRCVVPFGRRQLVGLVVGLTDNTKLDLSRLRPVGQMLDDIAPLSSDWLELTRFAASYYQHAWGEVALPALPAAFRKIPGPRAAQTLVRMRRSVSVLTTAAAAAVQPSEEQGAAIEAIAGSHGFAPTVLFGVTGSGKTEVYLAAVERVLAADPQAQALLLVPEINLTPALEAQLRARFPQEIVVSQHSGLADGERAAGWLAAHEVRARIVVGTRLAMFASMPKLAIIVVDEEHDSSFKNGEGVRWSARDLAVKRAQLLSIPVVLGSATPSLETWAHAASGAYRLLRLTQRAAAAARTRPKIELIDIRTQAPVNGLAPPVTQALADTLARGEQSLVFINRRGYAPVIACDACGWLSHCPRCSVFAVFHKPDRSLHCHHCGWFARAPRACPTCGNQDLHAVGQGTQRIEETLRATLPTARLLRIDRDSTRRKHAAQEALDSVHAGEVDVMVGTQMLAKGHDFQNVSLVAVLNADGQLASQDFRAPERLFAMLLQVAGRAGRSGLASRVLIQTRFPGHSLFAALAANDYAAFAATQLAERHAARMPPYTHQAMLTAQARVLGDALAFLTGARETARALASEDIRMFDPVPMPLARLAGVERAQLLIESDRRGLLQTFLRVWLAALREQKPAPRWQIEIDPLEI